jgi:hypothetical protein
MGQVRLEASMKLVMRAELAAVQRITVHTRFGEERSPQRPIAELCDAAPGPTEVVRIDHSMSKHHRDPAAAQKNFAHQHTRAPRVLEHESLVPIGPARTLEKHLDPYIGTASGDAAR